MKDIKIKFFRELDQAFLHEWESLFFPYPTQVAMIKVGDFEGHLQTLGKIEVETPGGTILTNKDEKQLKDLVKNKKLDNCRIILTNWWELIHKKGGIMFSTSPTSREELKEQLIKLYKRESDKYE